MDNPLSKTFLFSDFDGTLVSIRKDPAKVALTSQAHKTLALLARKIPIGIISGRSLVFLQKTIAIPEMILAGNHGLEIDMGRQRFRHPQAVSCQKEIQQLARGLKKKFPGIDGVFIEEKGLTLTFHYRLVPPGKREAVCKAFHDYLKTVLKEDILKVRGGKMALEVLPNIDWGKEDAIRWILERYKNRFPDRKVVPIYIGDDETDRAALALIQKIGISIFIGDAATTTIKATFFLPYQTQVIALLRQFQLEIDYIQEA